MVPAFVIIILFLACFMLTAFQYYRIDPERRLLNLRALLLILCTIGAFGYPLWVYKYPDDRRMSWFLLVAAIIMFATSYHLLRSMPRREKD